MIYQRQAYQKKYDLGIFYRGPVLYRSGGQACCPCLLWQPKRLTEKTDYTIAYKNNRQPGTAELVITGKGNYTDKKTLHFKILPKDIADKDIIIEDMAYADNGKPHKTAPSVIYNGKKLKAGRDFDITYGEGDYTAAGVYYAVITGKGNFTGARTTENVTSDGKPSGSKLTFEIRPKNLSDTIVTVGDLPEKLAAQAPKITVKDGTKVLPSSQYKITKIIKDTWFR